MLVIQHLYIFQRIPAEKRSEMRLSQLDQKNSISVTMR
jgi:hypothetical protein